MLRTAIIAFVTSTLPVTPALAQSITIERGACLGVCPIYRIEVTAAGNGTFEGRRFTTIHGKKEFSVTQEEWSAFKRVLAPFRPRGTEDITAGHPRCRKMAADHASVSVTWFDGEHTDRLDFNFGCNDPGNATMAKALADAADLLPAGKFIEDRRLEDGAWDRHPQ